MAHSENYEAALLEARAVVGDLRQAGDTVAAADLESDIERIIAWAERCQR